MPHWRKSYQPTSQFNSFAGRLVVGSVVLATLVLLSLHVYV